MPANTEALSGTLLIPLISFHSIVDEDIACLKYAILDIGINPHFDLKKLKSKTNIDIVGDLYHRKYKNPLYYIASDNADTDLLDRVYDEMLQEREEEVLKHAVSTDMFNLATRFKQESEIIPHILYYTDAQYKLLVKNKDLRGIKLVSLVEAINNKANWSQFFFRYISECEPFKDLYEKTFYISKAALNLNDDNSDIVIDEKDFNTIIRNRSKISLYDIYRTDIIGSYKNDN